MGNTSYVSLSLATTLERSLNATAHNLANAATAGYKAVRPIFESVVPGSDLGNEDAISYVKDRGNYLDVSQGAMLPTGNPLDLAVSGDAWFGFEARDGQTAYGRHGQLIVSVDGQLTTSTGQALLDASGAPIILPADVGQSLVVASDGTITDAQGSVLGRVGLFEIESDVLMAPFGNGLYISPLAQEAARPAQNATVAQGFVEASNVQPVIEMTRMIEIQRAYEGAVRLMEEDNDLTKQAIQRLGRIA